MGKQKKAATSLFNRALMLCVAGVLCLAMCPLPQAAASSLTLRGWNSEEEYQYVQFGIYTQDAPDEPILWRVLTVTDSGRALLLSERILECMAFNTNEDFNLVLEEIAERGLEQKEAHALIWEKSKIHHFLSNEFYNGAFTAEEKAAIYGDSTTGAKVTLPSRGELTRVEYGFQAKYGEADPNRSAMATAKAVDDSLWLSVEGYGTYYLRTIHSSNTAVDMVRGSGAIGSARVDRQNVGVRPIIWLDVNKVSFTGGEGTLESPYVQQYSGDS